MCSFVVSNKFCSGRCRGVPNTLMKRNNQTVPVDPSIVHEPDAALQILYLMVVTSQSSVCLATTPWRRNPQLFGQRESKIFESYPDFWPFFHGVVKWGLQIIS